MVLCDNPHFNGFFLIVLIFSLVICLCRDVDDVHDMMDDIQEQNEIAEEISNALSQPIGFAAEIDEVRTSWIYVTDYDKINCVDNKL